MKFSAAAVLCALVAASLYANTLDCGMCFDDETAIIDNKDLRPETPWSNLLWNDFWGVPMQSSDSHKSYRPLCVATFRLNYLIHELEPMGYHLVNVLLHSAVCYLYVLLCGVIFGDVWPALIAGLLFAVHPIHTEAVRQCHAVRFNFNTSRALGLQISKRNGAMILTLESTLIIGGKQLPIIDWVNGTFEEK